MPSTQHLEDVYRERFRALLERVFARRLEFGVELLVERARARHETESVPLAQALAELYESTRLRVEAGVGAMAACGMEGKGLPPPPASDPPRFVCDASLGGLARWLRAAGYEAVRVAAGGERAFAEAQRTGSLLLTSDAEVLKRR